MANELSKFSLSTVATDHVFYCVIQKEVKKINKYIFLTQIFFIILQFVFPEYSFILEIIKVTIIFVISSIK